MGTDRREFMAGAFALSAFGVATSVEAKEHGAMYGLIGKMTAKPGQRAALASVLLRGVSGMPGCRSYIVADDPTRADVLWITEAWESSDAHAASLSLPSVRDAIAEGRPMIASMETVAETAPVGGYGLAAK